jgi:hypothetical protein
MGEGPGDEGDMAGRDSDNPGEPRRPTDIFDEIERTILFEEEHGRHAGDQWGFVSDWTSFSDDDDTPV